MTRSEQKVAFEAARRGRPADDPRILDRSLAGLKTLDARRRRLSQTSGV